MMVSDLFQTFGVVVGSLILAVLMLISMLWLLLPLIVYQIRRRLDRMLDEAKETKQAIERLAKALEATKDS